MFITVLQDLDTTSVTTVLTYIISVLLVFIAAMFAYFKLEIKGKNDELKVERAWIKGEAVKNITALNNHSHALEVISKIADKTYENVTDLKHISEAIKPIIESNANRIIDIKSHLSNGS